MAATHVIFVSDTHLSPHVPHAQDNWAAVVGHITAAAPDLVIHLGDLSMDGYRDPAELQHARAQLELLTVPWTAIPGNHDIGDNPVAGTPGEHAISQQRRQRWTEMIGADWWSLAIGDWTLLAVNSQLAGSALAAADDQWQWLAGQVQRLGPGRRIALLTHKPVTAGAAELAAAPPYRFWPPAACRQLAGIFAGHPPDLVISGHVHQSRQLHLDGSWHLWVPTTWAVLPDDTQPVLGAKRCGVASLVFGAGVDPEPAFCEPAGLLQLTIGDTIEDRYPART